MKIFIFLQTMEKMRTFFFYILDMQHYLYIVLQSVVLRLQKATMLLWSAGL